MGAWTSRPSSMFGGKVSDHLDKDGINKFVRWSVEEIERKGLKTDALYRASGGHDEVQRIRGQPERGMQELLNQETNVHVLTGALKQFFRSLKQPILRIEEFQEVLEGRENGQDASDQLVDIINNVPKLQRPTLAYFFKHLFRVMHELDNNMSLASLGVVFGPTLMRVTTCAGEEDVATVQARIEDLNLVVELLLQHYCKAFNDHDDVTTVTSRGEEDDHRPPSCETIPGSPVVDGHLVSSDTTDISNTRVEDETSPGTKDADTQPPSNITDNTEHRSSSHHEAEEVTSGVAVDEVKKDQPVDNSADEKDNFEIIKRISDSEETPSLVTPTDRTTRTSSTLSCDVGLRKDSIQSTGRRCSETLDEDPMSKSSDSDDIDSVLAHMAKALSPELDHYKDCDRGSRTSSSSSDKAASRPSYDVATSEAKSSVYRLSAPRISIIEHTSSTIAMDGEMEGGDRSSQCETHDTREESHSTQASTMSRDETHIDADMTWSVEEKIRMFTKHAENVSSVKKQKVLGKQESEEERKVKTEFEETFEKVTQQKSS